MSPRSQELNEAMRTQSRAALVAAARKLFAGQGYFNCRITDVAREAGMSPGNVYWHFASKEELLKAVLADGFETLGKVMADAATAGGTASEKADTLLAGVLDFARQSGGFNTIMLSLIGHGGDAQFAQLGFDMVEIGMGYTQSVASIVAQGQAEGVIQGNINPIIPTMFFFGLFNGLNLTYDGQWLTLPPEVIRSTFRKLLGFAHIERRY